jgi:8-oxo-dGTP pyrophosphatase MutT (NUDIX family)
MIFLTKPEQFNPKFEVVSCFFEYDGRLLLLERQDHKPQGGTWGVPAGKIDPGETPEVAMLRELFQETGFVADRTKIYYLKKLFVRYPAYDFVYYIFDLKLDNEPIIKINPGEHKSFQWLSPTQALKIDLIEDLDGCISLSYKI